MHVGSFEHSSLASSRVEDVICVLGEWQYLEIKNQGWAGQLLPSDRGRRRDEH